jgi:ABC-type spermidine/putrescine transport system permease subunit II
VSSAARRDGGRRDDGRIALNAFVALAAAFLVLPILAIVPAAFSAQSFIRLPPDAGQSAGGARSSPTRRGA